MEYKHTTTPAFNRRRRRQRLAARIAGAKAAVQGVTLHLNPYVKGSPLSNEWLAAYATALSDAFLNDEPPKGLTL